MRYFWFLLFTGVSQARVIVKRRFWATAERLGGSGRWNSCASPLLKFDQTLEP